MCASFASDPPSPRQGVIPVRDAELFYRDIGQGQPIIILHGGIVLDHTYFLPDMDRLSDSYHLIYYDQRGRGKSIGDTANISIQTEMEDLDGLRQNFGLGSVAVLGHSWGAHLAMEYALGHPQHVSHLILTSTAAASRADNELVSQEWGKRLVPHEDRLTALQASSRYKEGDPTALAEEYRIELSTTIKQPEHLNRVNLSFDLSFAAFTKESVLRGRAIAERLVQETWPREEFDILPRLKQLHKPTLIIHGDDDFVPVEVAAHVARAVPDARFVLLKDCGHFSYVEAAEEFHEAVDAFFADTSRDA